MATWHFEMQVTMEERMCPMGAGDIAVFRLCRVLIDYVLSHLKWQFQLLAVGWNMTWVYMTSVFEIRGENPFGNTATTNERADI